MSFELPTSPFATDSYVVVYPDGRKSLYRDKLVYNPLPNDQYKLLIDGDTLDGIAFDYYGNSKYWWVLADVNNIENPFILETGTPILIPNLNNIFNV